MNYFQSILQTAITWSLHYSLDHFNSAGFVLNCNVHYHGFAFGIFGEYIFSVYRQSVGEEWSLNCVFVSVLDITVVWWLIVISFRDEPLYIHVWRKQHQTHLPTYCCCMEERLIVTPALVLSGGKVYCECVLTTTVSWWRPWRVIMVVVGRWTTI